LETILRGYITDDDKELSRHIECIIQQINSPPTSTTNEDADSDSETEVGDDDEEEDPDVMEADLDRGEMFNNNNNNKDELCGDALLKTNYNLNSTKPTPTHKLNANIVKDSLLLKRPITPQYLRQSIQQSNDFNDRKLSFKVNDLKASNNNIIRHKSSDTLSRTDKTPTYKQSLSSNSK
jgi:hypothetical protein